MVIEKVHGLQSTTISLNDRFTMLAEAAPGRIFTQRKRRNSASSIISQNYNYSDQLIEQVTRRLEKRVINKTYIQTKKVLQIRWPTDQLIVFSLELMEYFW